MRPRPDMVGARLSARRVRHSDRRELGPRVQLIAPANAKGAARCARGAGVSTAAVNVDTTAMVAAVVHCDGAISATAPLHSEAAALAAAVARVSVAVLVTATARVGPRALTAVPVVGAAILATTAVHFRRGACAAFVFHDCVADLVDIAADVGAGVVASVISSVRGEADASGGIDADANGAAQTAAASHSRAAIQAASDVGAGLVLVIAAVQIAAAAHAGTTILAAAVVAVVCNDDDALSDADVLAAYVSLDCVAELTGAVVRGAIVLPTGAIVRGGVLLHAGRVLCGGGVALAGTILCCCSVALAGVVLRGDVVLPAVAAVQPAFDLFPVSIGTELLATAVVAHGYDRNGLGVAHVVAVTGARDGAAALVGAVIRGCVAAHTEAGRAVAATARVGAVVLPATAASVGAAILAASVFVVRDDADAHGVKVILAVSPLTLPETPATSSTAAS